VETLVPQLLGDKNTSLVLLSLLIATRFRSLYFDNFDLTAAKFDDKVSDTEFQGNYWQFLTDFEQVREQAKDQAFDSKTFIESFGETRKGIAESFVEAGKQAREALEESLPGRDAPINRENRPKIKQSIMQFMKKVESVNAHFLRVAADVYHAELEEQLRKTAI
jgi:hypothetical protein